MSDTTETPTPESSTPNPKRTDDCKRHRHGRRGGLRRFFGATLFVGALVAVPFAVAHAARGHGFGGCHGRDAPTTAAELRERMDQGAGFFYDRVDATAEQEAAIDAVLDRVAPSLFALRDQKEALHDDVKVALTADQVDAAELERLRKEGLALADEASRIVVSGVAEIAKVLDPEQRRDLAEAAARFHGK